MPERAYYQIIGIDGGTGTVNGDVEMANQMLMLLPVMLALMVCASSALPSGHSVLQSSGLSAEKRPKYMDTRELDVFKYMLMASIRELVEEGEINPAVLGGQEGEEEQQQIPGELTQVAKRMRYMGICMRRRYNTFIPYPCLRSGRR